MNIGLIQELRRLLLEVCLDRHGGAFPDCEECTRNNPHAMAAINADTLSPRDIGGKKRCVEMLHDGKVVAAAESPTQLVEYLNLIYPAWDYELIDGDTAVQETITKDIVYRYELRTTESS